MSRLLLLQLDGLSRPQFQASLAQMPCLQRLLGSTHQLHTMYSGLPSTTPAFQGEFFYGVRQCVPAWYFREASSGELAQLIYTQVSRRRERQLSARGSGLLQGGSAYTCLMSGGAHQVHFGAGQSRLEYLQQVFRLWPQAGKILNRAGWETCKALKQTLSAGLSARLVQDELLFLPKRTGLHAIINGYYRKFIPKDMSRGVPIIYANFLSYDCLAHLRGPASHYALQSLPEIDRLAGELIAQAENYGYQVWVFSDHGQEPTASYHPYGSGMLAERLGVEAMVADHGPVAHLYFRSAQRQRLAERLVEQAGVPQVLFLDSKGVRVLNHRGLFRLPQDWEQVVGAEHPFGPEAGLDLARMAHHPESGQLVALGFLGPNRITFLREAGSHGGPGPLETHAFALLPESIHLRGSARGLNGPVARPLDLRRAVLSARQSQAPTQSSPRPPARPQRAPLTPVSLRTDTPNGPF